LLNQKSHLLWLPLDPPPEALKLKSRTKFHKDCAIKIEIKLFYCQRISIQQKFDYIVECLKNNTMKGTVSVPVGMYTYISIYTLNIYM
jgi:hypothetical protein